LPSLNRHLPNLGALVAFEAVARHLSITQAAGELGLTQAAVSRKIRALEEDLGVALFRRLHRALRLTPEGERLHAAVSGSLHRIAETAEGLRRQGSPAQISVAGRGWRRRTSSTRRSFRCAAPAIATATPS